MSGKSEQLTAEAIKAAQKGMSAAALKPMGPAWSWHGVEGYGVLHIRDGKPHSLDCGKDENGNDRGAMWDDIPAEHQAKILELLNKGRGTVTVESVDTATNTLYMSTPQPPKQKGSAYYDPKRGGSKRRRR